MNIEYIETDEHGLDLIGPLWAKLNEHHRERSPYHAAHFTGMTFDKRKRSLLEKSAGGAMRVDIARDKETGENVGYCVSTISKDGQGEIDSIYIEPVCRHQGIGDALMNKALGWMDGKRTTKRVVEVAAGNEEVFPFYRRYGFFPRSTLLRTVPDCPFDSHLSPAYNRN
jgi:ribosomal protein S18 acetylase RimI-like enzyme